MKLGKTMFVHNKVFFFNKIIIDQLLKEKKKNYQNQMSVTCVIDRIGHYSRKRIKMTWSHMTNHHRKQGQTELRSKNKTDIQAG